MPVDVVRLAGWPWMVSGGSCAVCELAFFGVGCGARMYVGCMYVCMYVLGTMCVEKIEFESS